jgi:hypothetical protein
MGQTMGSWNWDSLVRGYFRGSDYSSTEIAAIVKMAEQQKKGVWHAASTALHTPCGCAECGGRSCPLLGAAP